MQVKTFCKDCDKSYYWFADDGTILDCGCDLDLPLFDKSKLIICNSFRNKRE